jgi:hypothetical protein
MNGNTYQAFNDPDGVFDANSVLLSTFVNNLFSSGNTRDTINCCDAHLASAMGQNENRCFTDTCQLSPAPDIPLECAPGAGQVEVSDLTG